MKLRRFLSGLLFGTGCALTFVGLLSVALPSISNPQLQLVLASFAEPSNHAFISLINRFMSFALSQSWRLFFIGLLIGIVGAWLLILFSPRKPLTKRTVPPSEPSPAPQQPVYEPQPMAEAEAPNPFASGVYATQREEPVKAAPPLSFHARPMLEPNKVEEPPLYSFSPDADAQPYFSARLETESRAIQAEVGEASQSGSRILIRPAPAAAEAINEPAAPEPPAAPPAPITAPVLKPSTSPSSPVRTASSSPRIRSTMGRHTSGSVKFPSAHS